MSVDPEILLSENRPLFIFNGREIYLNSPHNEWLAFANEFNSLTKDITILGFGPGYDDENPYVIFKYHYSDRVIYEAYSYFISISLRNPELQKLFQIG